MATNCIITVVNEFDQALDDGMLEAVMARASRHIPNARFIDIYTSPREEYGLLEWIMKITYHSSNVLVIGCIQRKPDAEYEFHS